MTSPEKNPLPSVNIAAPCTLRWWVFAVVLAAEVMDLLGATVVNVAGPSLERSLHASSVQLQWVIGGYALAMGAGLILGGRLGDKYGRRATFLTSLSAFTVASLLCAFAPNIAFLIGFRVLQGAAAAMLLPQGQGLLRENFDGSELSKAYGFYGPVMGLVSILGPVLGGCLIQWDFFHLSWRLVFLADIPIGVAAWLVGMKVLPPLGGTPALAIDSVGAAIVAGACFLFALPLNLGQSQGWPFWTWICFAVSLAGFVLFARQQRHVARSGGTPLVVPTVFDRTEYVVGLCGLVFFSCALVGTQLALTLFLQIGEGFSAGRAGLWNMPMAIGTAIGATISGIVLVPRLGHRVLQLGAIVQFVGVVAIWFGLTANGAFAVWRITPGVFLTGLGAGLSIAALFSSILLAVGRNEIGSASGMMTAAQALSGAIGVAGFASAFFAALHSGGVHAFRVALILETLLLAAFLIVTFFMPSKPVDAMVVEQPLPANEIN